ncbi:hypothetical protein CLOBOL_01597 [Enterocloster bolteae ATCC BAA-613]|uniref:Uncharacterized protein n=1 Tax=Enterocloster bolteae (strain ATCC BAA-613 / DSM 15670 / CCUG 46953 / JCM 12243 / WAL 16351) TaxID=411902 RepID=A8RLE8_ENTBW|nr:hypothetical protein CLOBOL_01597 [Enterocloster bolteae ATCC BAA-613]
MLSSLVTAIKYLKTRISNLIPPFLLFMPDTRKFFYVYYI